MVFFELIIIIFFILQLHDLFKETLMTQYARKYDGKSMDYIKEKEENFIPLAIVILIGLVIELLLLIYLATKQYLFPFSLIVLIIHLTIIFQSYFKQAKDKGTIKYPSLFRRVIFKILALIYLIFYGAMLYKLFIG